MNFLDIIKGGADETYTGGQYYSELPSAAIPGDEDFEPQSAPEIFNYEYVDLTSRRYARIFGNVVTVDGATTCIKTRSDISFAPDGYVALRDGYLYQIMDVGIDTRSAPKEAARFLLAPTGAEKVLRLNRIEDAWGIAGRR